MADFLTRMTQRTLGLLPVVQPFIASKYASESMGAAIPSGLTPSDPFQSQTVEESSENWEEETERVPPVSMPQSVAPREVRNDTIGMPGVSQSVALPQEEPSTTLLPTQGHSHSLPNTTSIPVNSLDVVLSQPQTSDRQENESFSTAPTASTVPTPLPRPAQVKPSSRSDVGTRFIASRTGEPLVAAQSEEIPQNPRIPHASIQAVPYKSGVEDQHLSPSSEESSVYTSIQAAGHNEVSSVREIPYVKNFNSESPALVSSAADPTGNFPANKQNVASARRMNTEVTETRLVPAPTVDLPSADSPTLITGTDLVEPMFASVYQPVQAGRTATTAAGKRVASPLSESYGSPTIKVTIGRIDVRAVTPPAPVSPAPVRVQRARPALSLDDYLKQRNGGQQ